MKSLIIVESPNKIKKISSFLDNTFIVSATAGHIYELDTSKGLKCIGENYDPIMKIIPTKSKYIKTIREKYKECQCVYLATDADNEGERIAFDVCSLLKLPLTTKRLIFREITKSAILKAIQTPTHIDIHKVEAQKARSVLDLLIGFKLSPQISRSLSIGGLSLGRCQTPALRLVYENQEEIDNSPPKTTYKVKGVFTDRKITFNLNRVIPNEEDVKQFMKKSKSHHHLLSFSPLRKSIERAPMTLTTSSLQQKASNELHYSPKDTMKMAQTLYEHGYITYMRTDSHNISKEFISKIVEYIHREYTEDYVKPTLDSAFGMKKKSAQEAHECIRPTDIQRIEVNVGEREKRLYRLIWTTTLQACMADAEFLAYDAYISAPIVANTEQDDEQEDVKEGLHYITTMKQLVFEGFLIVDKQEATPNELFYYLCPYETNTDDIKTLFGGLDIPETTTPDIPDMVQYDEITACVSLSGSILHYTEAKLISTLEKKGIGRPSTYATLISVIQERRYVEKTDIKGKEYEIVDYKLKGTKLTAKTQKKTLGGEKSKLCITDLGKEVIQFALTYYKDLFEYTYTSQMETKLDEVAKNKYEWRQVCREGDEILNTLIGTTKQIKVKKEANIIGEYEGHPIEIKEGRYGVYAVWKETRVSVKSKEANVETEIIPMLKLAQMNPLFKTMKTNSERNQKHVETPEMRLQYRALMDNPTYSGIVRPITDTLSIRKGKYGAYIFYKTTTMKTPKFLKLKGFTEDPIDCELSVLSEWIETTYHSDLNIAI
jgi:DNA topoisomerase I